MPLTQDQKLKRQGDIVNAKDLHYAIRSGNCGLLEKLCESGADPNQPDEDGNLPLNAAISKDSPEMVSILCRFGANTNLPDKFGKFPLHRAIQKNSSMMVRILCEFGADVEKQNSKEGTPLRCAYWRRLPNYEIVELLFQYGAYAPFSLDFVDYGRSTLFSGDCSYPTYLIFGNYQNRVFEYEQVRRLFYAKICLTYAKAIFQCNYALGSGEYWMSISMESLEKAIILAPEMVFHYIEHMLNGLVKESSFRPEMAVIKTILAYDKRLFPRGPYQPRVPYRQEDPDCFTKFIRFFDKTVRRLYLHNQIDISCYQCWNLIMGRTLLGTVVPTEADALSLQQKYVKVLSRLSEADPNNREVFDLMRCCYGDLAIGTWRIESLEELEKAHPEEFSAAVSQVNTCTALRLFSGNQKYLDFIPQSPPLLAVGLLNPFARFYLGHSVDAIIEMADIFAQYNDGSGELFWRAGAVKMSKDDPQLREQLTKAIEKRSALPPDYEQQTWSGRFKCLINFCLSTAQKMPDGVERDLYLRYTYEYAVIAYRVFGANLSYIKIFGDRLVTRAARFFSGGHDFCAGFPHGLSDNLNLSDSSAPHFHLFLDRCRTILLSKNCDNESLNVSAELPEQTSRGQKCYGNG